MPEEKFERGYGAVLRDDCGEGRVEVEAEVGIEGEADGVDEAPGGEGEGVDEVMDRGGGLEGVALEKRGGQLSFSKRGDIWMRGVFWVENELNVEEISFPPQVCPEPKMKKNQAGCRQIQKNEGKKNIYIYIRTSSPAPQLH